jgi:L-threonylcarbamoyladenylate synthase
MLLSSAELTDIANLLRQGKIIACPTEGVFGLSCDPFNEKAIQQLLVLKKRVVEKGLILMTHDWHSIESYLAPLDSVVWEKLNTATNTPTTWILPVRSDFPTWLSGEHATVAARLVAHPTARAICAAFGGPLVSTSANVAGHPPCFTWQEVEAQFGSHLAYIVRGETLGLNKPSQIIEAMTGMVLRA